MHKISPFHKYTVNLDLCRNAIVKDLLNICPDYFPALSLTLPYGPFTVLRHRAKMLQLSFYSEDLVH